MKLYEHQNNVLKKTQNFSRCAYYLDMGLGKTFVGAEKAVNLNKNILLVCQKSKVQDWINHFKEHYKIKTFDLTKNLESFLLFDDKKVGVINYDILYRRKELEFLTEYTLMFDESSYLKNDKAKRTKVSMKLSNNADNLILLSGTPISGKYEELYPQLKMLGYPKTKAEFYNKYIIQKLINVGYTNINIVVGYKNVEDLKKECAKYGCVFMKTEEVLNLPEQTFIEVKSKAPKLYNKFKENKYVKIGDVELVGDTKLTELLYLRQLSGLYNSDKLVQLKDLLNSSSDRFIIFYNFTAEKELIKSNVDKPISEISGDKVDLTNYNNADDSVTLVQYQAGSMGHNLQKANKIIYFSPPLSSELYEQSKKRIHRIGQPKPCYYYNLITENSVEENIYKTLEKRKDYTNALFKQEN